MSSESSLLVQRSAFSVQRWLSLSDAAARSGKHPDHLSKLCRTKWLALGQAELRQPEEGGKPIWHIRQDADPAFLAPVAQGRALDANISDSQRRVVADRQRIILEWRKLIAAGITLGQTESRVTNYYIERLLIQENKKISRATLFNWWREYQSQGPNGLLDVRKAKGSAIAAAREDDPFFQNVKRLYLTQQQRSMKACYDFVVMMQQQQAALGAGNAGPFPSYHMIRRALGEIPRQIVIKARQGNKAFNDQCMPFIRREYSSIASNEIWCADHHRFDVTVIVGYNADGSPRLGRPEVTGFEDLRSRKIVGWWISETPNSETIYRAFFHAAAPSQCGHGLPQKLMVDNGKDFLAKMLNGRSGHQHRRNIAPNKLLGGFGLLGVEMTHVQPYHGQSKPIERMFGTVCGRFAKLWDTYCGNSPDNRPENHTLRIAQGRAPTMEEFIAAFAAWLETDYHDRIHTGDAMDTTPRLAWEANLDRKLAVTDEQLRYAFLRHGPVKVHRNGVRWQGLEFGGFDAEVHRYYGKEVILIIDADDLSQVTLLDLEGNPLCLARKNLTSNFKESVEDRRAAMAKRNRIKKAITEYQAVRPQISMVNDMPALLAEAAARRNSEFRIQNSELIPSSLRINPALESPSLPAPAPTLLEPAIPTPTRLTYRRSEPEDVATESPTSLRELMASRNDQSGRAS